MKKNRQLKYLNNKIMITDGEYFRNFNNEILLGDCLTCHIHTVFIIQKSLYNV